MATPNKKTVRPRHRPTLCTPEVMDRLVQILRMGSFVEQACAQAGISKDSFYKWLKRGVIERRRREKYLSDLEEEAAEDATRKRQIRQEERKRRTIRDRKHKETSTREQVFLDFADAIEKAQAEGENAMLSVISRSAAGGSVIRRFTRTTAEGDVVTTEQLAQPDWRAAAWRLEKRHPKRWGVQALDVKVDADVSVTNTVARDRLISALARLSGGSSDDVDKVKGDNLDEE